MLSSHWFSTTQHSKAHRTSQAPLSIPLSTPREAADSPVQSDAVSMAAVPASRLRVQVGQAAGAGSEAVKLVDRVRARLRAVARDVVACTHRPRVLILTSTEPLCPAGWWVPDMQALAGGQPSLQHSGCAPQPLCWDQVGSVLHFMRPGCHKYSNQKEGATVKLSSHYLPGPHVRDACLSYRPSAGHYLFAVDIR